MKLCWISTWPPRWCPVASYSQSIVSKIRQKTQVEIISHTDAGIKNETHLWPVIDLENADWFRKTDETLQRIDPDAVVIQLDFFGFGYQPVSTHFVNTPADSFGILEILFRLKSRKIPIVIAYHNLVYPLSDDQKLFYGLSTKLSDASIVFSSEQKRILENIGVYKNRIFVIPPSAEINEKSIKEHLKGKWNLDSSKITIGLVGWWEEYKGFDKFLEIWPKILKDHPDVELVVAGLPRPGILESINSEKKITSLIEKNKEKNIKLVNRTFSDDEFNELVASLDILVLPYLECAQSLLIAKAYASGVPVLASNVGGLRSSVLESHGGILYSNQNTLMQNLSRLIENPNLCQSLGLKGRQYIKRNSMDKIVERYLEVIKNVKSL